MNEKKQKIRNSSNQHTVIPKSGLNSSHLPKIEIEDLVKIYKQGRIEVLALRGLNATFYQGEIVIIEGPSGCGKTTLVNIVGGLDRQSAGEIRVNQRLNDQNEWVSLNHLSDHELELYRKNHIGIVFQFMNLIPTLTAEENVALPLLMNGVPRKQRKKQAENMLKLTGIDHRKRHKPDELSGGEQQRVAIAAALINDPDIIIADEPTGNLDSETREEILDLFKSIIQKYPQKSIIIVTHDNSVERIADRILRIEDGKIYAERRPLEEKQPNSISLIKTHETELYQQKIASIKQKIGELYNEISDI